MINSPYSLDVLKTQDGSGVTVPIGVPFGVLFYIPTTLFEKSQRTTLPVFFF